MASPSRVGALSKLRRNQGGSNNSTNTLASSSTSDDPPLDVTRQITPDTGISKLKGRFRRKSVDERPTSSDSTRRFSAFVPGRRNKTNANSSTDLAHQLSVNSSNGNLELYGNHSESSLGLEDSGHSSLLTDDNDASDHSGKPVRPPLSTHNSHAGYLTLSSPDIKSQTQSIAPETLIPEVAHRSASTTNIPRIIEPLDNEPGIASGSVERSRSPGGRLREAFSVSRKKSTGDIKSASSGEGSGALFRTSSRGSGVLGQEVLIAPDISERVARPQPEKSAEEPVKAQVRPETPQSSARPQVTTGSLPETPPNTVQTPTTFITPPTPTDPHIDAPTFLRTSPTKPSTFESPSPPSSSLKGRRINLPSKLSQSVPAPLTPTLEETKTPGGTLAQPANASGFFSSVFTAAQRAADSLSTSINTSIATGQKSKSITSQPLAEHAGEEVVPGVDSLENNRAVDTLGSGSLNLSYLGIVQTEEPTSMVSSTDLPLQNGAVAVNGASQKAEEEAAARAVSEAYSEPIEKVVAQAAGVGRPSSIASTERLTLAPGEGTPPRPVLDDALRRTGSTRSRLSGRRRRHRGSSATAGTGNTIAAGLAAHGSGLGNLAVNGAGHRLTGFAVASNKRNKDFHQLFRSVPEDDYLIEDYSAALQRDILLHGRLYVSEGHICFSSNILGWVTNLVISFDEVVSVEKKSTAMIFPNAIVIATSQARNTFASFVARDSTYELLIGIWKISHPNLKSSLNGVTLDDAGTGDKTEVADPDGSEGGSDSGSEDEVYDEDQDDDAGSFEDGGLAPSITASDAGERTLSRQPSGTPLAPAAAAPPNGAPKGLENADAVVVGAAAGADFPGPPIHEPTQCTDGAEHYDKPLTDEIIPAPLGKVYSMVFGPAMGTFMRKWLVEDQKSRELNMPESKTGLDNANKTLILDYIKPLNAPMGPKQTKCITTYTLVAFDLEKVVTVDCSTQTPDVPSGNVFTTKTRYCLMWGPGNSTRMIANSTVEWSGKSWLKGPIENGASAGQLEYVKALVAALKAAVTTKPPVKGVPRKGKRKSKKEVFDAEEAIARRESVVAVQQESNWGPLEPVHALLKPIIALLNPFLTSQTIIAVLLALLLYTWMSPPGRRAVGVGFPGFTSPERLAAYDEMWRREESNLWDWLEDRVGLDGIYAPSLENDKRERQKVLAARNMGKKLHDERMNQRQMDDAIRVTEQRLTALKDAVAKQKEQKMEKA